MVTAMANHTSSHAIPRRLDDPGKFLFWEMDVAMVAAGAIAAGVLAGTVSVGIVLGIAGAALYNRLKAGKHRGMALHLLYWHLGWPHPKCVPPSHIRELIS